MRRIRDGDESAPNEWHLFNWYKIIVAQIIRGCDNSTVDWLLPNNGETKSNRLRLYKRYPRIRVMPVELWRASRELTTRENSLRGGGGLGEASGTSGTTLRINVATWQI
ncbi:uncharacterized protein LOC143902209 isoform X1 [Temnothorax americanus]|uniref:uncharacterized protein LOC143902209 isoform X1 n=1 Tax=Temnothorax americanus TaxID=1964332 RepID=UPI00406940F3